MHSIAKLIQLRSDLKISVVWFICQIVVGNIVNVITLFKFLKRVKANSNICHIPVILLSAKSSLSDQIQGLEYIPDEVIIKMSHLGSGRFYLVCYIRYFFSLYFRGVIII